MEESQKIIKVILVGETAVGKSSIINKYVHGSYNSNFQPTLAAAQIYKEIEYPKLPYSVRLELWDTAGQEKYRSIINRLYQGASAALIVYDITRKESFTEIKEFWYKELKEKAPEDIVLVLVGNKSDLYDMEEVSKNDREELLKETGMLFYQTSALSGNGIEDLFYEIGLKCASSQDFEQYLIDKEMGNLRIEKEDKNKDETNSNKPKVHKKSINKDSSAFVNAASFREPPVERKCC